MLINKFEIQFNYNAKLSRQTSLLTLCHKNVCECVFILHKNILQKALKLCCDTANVT